MRKIVSLFVAALCLSCTPKPRPEDGLGSPGIIECGKQAISSHAAESLGPINGCLAGEGDILGCLLGLVRPAVGVTLSIVGCLTKHEGAAASAASQANPEDTVDARRAARAREFLEKMAERNWQFRD